MDGSSFKSGTACPYKTIAKSWGREEIYSGREVNSPYCIKKLVYNHRIASSLHYHNYKHETFCVLKGMFSLEMGAPGAGKEGWSEVRRLKGGDVAVIPQRTRHRLRLLSKPPGVILECSTADDPEDCVRLAVSEKP